MTAEIFESSRRGFVKRGLGLGLGLAGAATGGKAMARTLAGYQPHSLTVPELAAVKALMARLIPADDARGGAVEACAHVYLDRALGAYHAKYLVTWRAGLAELDRWARQERHPGLAAMPGADLDALIARLEKGELTGGGFVDGGKGFFNLARRHTIEGFLTDPMYGGNKDFLGWEVIGFHGVQLWYSAEAQQLNARDDRHQRSIADYGGSPAA